MPIFPSREWAEALRAALNASGDFQKSAADFRASFIFHIEADPPLVADRRLFVDVVDGACSEVVELDAASPREADYTLRGKYGDWARVLKGELNPVEAVLGRRLQVKGNVAGLLRHVGVANALAEATRTLETTFL